MLSDYEEVVRETHGTADDIVSEVYGRKPKVKPPKPPKPKKVRAPRKPPVSRETFRVLGSPSVRCSCGMSVYAVKVGKQPAALPTHCWRCPQPLI